MIREEIKKLIEKAVKDLYKKEIEVEIERPAKATYGDYSTNIAMIFKKNPQEIASIIKSDILEKIKVKNGFINFFLSKEYLQKQVDEILKQGEKFGQLNIGKKIKTQVEFISANPTGPLHIGNGRGAFFGDTLANILKKTGYKVTREYYINDAKNSNQIRELGKTALRKGITYLTKNLEFKIKNLEAKLKKISDEGEAGYLLAQNVQKDIKDFIEKRLKIKFDNWISEEDLYKKNKIDKIFNWLKDRDLIYQKAGAWWIKTSEFGDSQDWVIIRTPHQNSLENKGGEPTYLLSDIAYHKDKFDRGFQKIIDIWGADHQGHVSKIKAVAKMLGYKGDLNILISQVVRFKKGKISKRKSQIITLEDLINEVGLDVARFLYLTKSLNTQMEFDLELAKEQSEKNPVFYVQYAHARICSILRKAPSKNYWSRTSIDYSLLNHPSELGLIKQLIRFPEIVEDTAKDYQIQRLPQYAIDLATIFHQFYRDCKVLTKDKNLREARLALILATKIILKNTLNLMGISAPKRM
ncbi:MAG: arginine--tRNA ligase [Patescibacteria group bacterium]|nr:arginine--tRNA ligase [Patescibacteria group bacterium]